MRSKPLIICLLTGLNVLLALAVFFSQSRLPAALAQAGLQRGEFLAVTAKPEGQIYDVVWVVDLANDKLIALYPNQPTQRQLRPAEPRDLLADFGRKTP